MDLHAPHASTTELDRLGDEIAELSVHLEAASARLLDLIRDFDTRAGWNNGFRSCAEWLSWRVGLDLGAAREKVRVARALATLPRLAQALAHGELSYAKVRALTRVATPATEERLLAIGRVGTAEHVERIVRGWRRMDRKAERDEAARQHTSRALYVYPAEDGTVTIRGRLAPEAGALFLKALTAAREALYQRERAHAAAAQPADVSRGTSGHLPGRRFRIFTRQFKEAAVQPDPGRREDPHGRDGCYRVRPQLLYTWRDHYEQGGADALVPRRAAIESRRHGPSASPAPGAQSSGTPISTRWSVRGSRLPPGGTSLDARWVSRAVELDFFKAAFAARQSATSAERRAWRQSVFALIHAMTPPQGALGIERMCTLSGVSRASYYRHSRRVAPWPGTDRAAGCPPAPHARSPALTAIVASPRCCAVTAGPSTTSRVLRLMRTDNLLCSTAARIPCRRRPTPVMTGGWSRTSHAACR